MTDNKTNIEDLSKEIIHHRRRLVSDHEGTMEFHLACITKLQQQIKDQVGFTPYIYEDGAKQVRVW